MNYDKKIESSLWGREHLERIHVKSKKEKLHRDRNKKLRIGIDIFTLKKKNWDYIKTNSPFLAVFH